MHLHFVSYYVAFRHTAMASRLLQASPLFASGRLTIKRLKELARRYFVALLAPAVIAGVMQVTWPFFQSAPVAPYFVAVIFCAWYGGLGPGLLSVLISFLLSDVLFIGPYFFFWPSKEFNLGRILLFAVVGPFISVMSELMHRERRRTEINLESTKRAERSLSEKESFARQIAELSPVVINVFSLAMRRYVYASPDVVNLLGYTSQEMLEMEDPVSILWHPEDIPLANENLARFIHARDGEIFEIEYRIRRRDGEWRWLASRLMPFERDEDGVVGKMVTASLDITERKHAEESLRLFRNLIDQSSDAIEVLDPTTMRFLDCNTAAHETLGYTREEFLSLTSFDIDPIIDQSIIAQVAEEMNKSSFVIFESVHRRKDGSTFPVEINAKTIRLERDYRLAVVRDITERKQAEEKLRQSHRQLQNILDSLFAFVGVFSTEGVVLEVNRAPLEAAALKREEVLGKSFPETYWWSYSTAVQDRLRAALQRAAQGEVVRYDEVIRMANDQRVTIDVAFGPLRDAEGKITQIVGSGVDITERKRAEQALKATSEQLRALSARLQFAREEEGTRIARELHDELGSALTSLRWSLDEIDSLLSTDSSKLATDNLHAKIATMTTLVEGTLQTVRRISSELRPGVLDEVGLIPAIEWEAQQFEARTGIVCYFDSSMPDIHLTREQSTAIFRILQEALTNVLRHAKATRVEVMLKEEQGGFVLTISDDGRGISEEEKSGAKSLGLLGMRERAHLIGGEVSITSHENQGTTVTVRLPVLRAPAFEE